MIWTKNKAPLKSTATLADLDGKMLKNRFWEALKLEKCRDGPCHKEFDVKRKGPKNWSSHSKLMVHPKTLEAFWSVLVTSGRYLRNSFLTRGFKVTCFGHLICVFLSHKNVSIFDTETYKSCKCEYVYIHVCVWYRLWIHFFQTPVSKTWELDSMLLPAGETDGILRAVACAAWWNFLERGQAVVSRYW